LQSLPEEEGFFILELELIAMKTALQSLPEEEGFFIAYLD